VRRTGLARNPNAAAPIVEAALDALIERAPDRGVTTAFNIVDMRPDAKPSRNLSIDPNDAYRRWWQSVHACVA